MRSVLAQLDCLLSFACVAKANQYAKPEINDSLVLISKEEGTRLSKNNCLPGESYVPNDIFLDSESNNYCHYRSQHGR